MTKINFKKFAGAWSPQKEGEEISGEIISILEKVGKYETKVYVLKTEQDIKDVFGCTVIDQEFTKNKVKEGDHIKIVYLGKRKGEDAEYKNYDIYLGFEE